jgi:hypothetical protein
VARVLSEAHLSSNLISPSGPNASPWVNTSETLKQANPCVAAADGVPPRPRLAGRTPEGGEGGDGCLGIGPLVWNLAKLAPRNRGTRQSTPPVSAQGANQSPTSHVAHRLADARGSAGTGYGQALSGNGVRDGGSSRKDACANLVGPSGALVVKAREFAPLASPGAVHYVSLLWFIAILLGIFYTEKER